MWDLGVLRDRGDFARRLAVTAVALIIYRLGAHIPLPGLDPHALSMLYGSDGTGVERISILALGIYPLVSVLIMAELAKVVLPPLRRWEYASARNRDSLNRWIVLLAIGAAVVQSTGYAGALESIKQLVAEPGVSFKIGCVASMVAGTAFAIWLADLITRKGLGSGVWLLFVVPALVDLPYHASEFADPLAAGYISPAAVALTIALPACAMAALSSVMLAIGDQRRTASGCLWPMLTAHAVWPYILVTLSFIAPDHHTVGATHLMGEWVVNTRVGGTLRMVSLVILIAGFAALHMRSLPPSEDARPQVPTAIIATALVGVALAASDFLTGLFGVPRLLHAELIVAITVIAIFILPELRTQGPEPEPQSSGVK